MPSFDVVSEVETAEVLNSASNATKMLSTRFDFRGVEASFTHKDGEITMKCDADFRLQQMLDLLRMEVVKRKIDASSMDVQDVVHTGKNFSQKVVFKQGVEMTVAKKVVKAIKDSKVKVQAAIQGEQIRVTGKKRDDLQEAMALIRKGDFGQPFQFTNFKD